MAGADRREKGMVLITVLLSLLLIGGFALMVQQVTLSRSRVVVAVIAKHQEQLDRASAIAVLTPLVGETLLNLQDEISGPLFLDGRQQTIEVNGREVAYQLQDIESLPDLYLTRPELFDELFPGHPSLNAAAVRRFRETVGRNQVANEMQALSVMGVANAMELEHLVTIQSRDGRIDTRHLPEDLRGRIEQPNRRSGDDAIIRIRMK